MDQFYRSLLATLIANLRDGVLAEDEQGRIVVANEAVSRMFGLAPAAELIGVSVHDIRELMWPELVADVNAHRALTVDLRKRTEPQLNYELKLKDGRVFDRDYIPIPAPDGSFVHMWHYREVTARRQLENRLHESRRRLRELSAFAEQAREDERRQLARRLHDELGQLFSSIRLELGAAITQFRQTPLPELRPIVDRLQAAAGLTDIGVASLRQLTTTLRPPVLDHLGIVSAIRWEASLFSKRTGIRCHVRARSAVNLDEARGMALYRILLEALENISRHADAGTTWIRLSRQRGTTVMDVRDNGRGITEEQINNPRTMGLLGMRERALAFGGDLRITGARGRGTRVQVTLPDATPPDAPPPKRSKAHV